MKTCTRCGREKPLTAFSPHKGVKIGRASWCKECARHRARLKRGVKVAEGFFDRLVLIQEGRCAICGTETDQLVLDHDHLTGDVRGALCQGCNRGLGLFRDDPTLLRRAADYLEGTTWL